LFSSNVRDMARALNLSSRDLNLIFYGRVKTSVRFLAHVASCLDVRPEWLLCGTGNIFRADSETDGLHLPITLQSAFPLFDPRESTGNLPRRQLRQEAQSGPVTDLNAYLNAGRALYSANVNNKPVGFFLGAAPFQSQAANCVADFYRAGWASFLCLTLPAVAHALAATDALRSVSLNELAKFAATRGIGYGEALNTLPRLAAAFSLLDTVRELAIPISVSVEFGEIAEHTAPSLHGAEVGAAIGAAAYVDLLVLTEQLKAVFADPPGVLLFAGDQVRGVNLALQRIESLQAFVTQPASFTFVVFAKHDADLETLIHQRGGHVIFLDPPTTAAFAQLFQTCNDVYAGKNTHEHRG
jgi:hypothetical protein